SGLIGSALVRSLRDDGHDVVRVVRSGSAGDGDATTVAWDPMQGTIDAAGLEGVEAAVHLAGAGIGDERWSDDRKRVILESRTKGTALLARTLAGLAAPPAVLLSGSAVGYYGDRGDEVCTETSPAGTGYLAEVCESWEAAATPAVEAGIRTAFLRTGIVQTKAGGALKKTLPLFKLGLGGRFGSGKQWWSWISLADEVGAIRHLLDHDVSGPVNLTAPAPVTNAEYTSTLGSVLGRPTVLPVPSFGPKLLLGAEGAKAVLLDGQRAVPAVLEREGYSFRHPTLEAALRAELSR
ncbi:MAG: TIGR01777 family oxidoreductase, partial [Acidimicrobiales bacterium]